MALTPWGKRHETLQRAEGYLAECCGIFELPQKKFTKGAEGWLARRRFRDECEMKQLIFTAALLSPAFVVDAIHFPPRQRDDHEAFNRAQLSDISLEEVVFYKIAHFFERLQGHHVTGVHKAVMEHVERPLISLALEWAEGHKEKAAEALGLHRNTLRKKMRELDIQTKQRDKGPLRHR